MTSTFTGATANAVVPAPISTHCSKAYPTSGAPDSIPIRSLQCERMQETHTADQNYCTRRTLSTPVVTAASKSSAVAHRISREVSPACLRRASDTCRAGVRTVLHSGRPTGIHPRPKGLTEGLVGEIPADEMHLFPERVRDDA